MFLDSSNEIVSWRENRRERTCEWPDLATLYYGSPDSSEWEEAPVLSVNYEFSVNLTCRRGGEDDDSEGAWGPRMRTEVVAMDTYM